MYKLLLCFRYLRTRYIALASIISVMLGVATMIVVNSVMAGFGSEMRERIHGILADVIVETTSLDGTPDVDKHMQTIRDIGGDNIESMTATVEVYGMLSFKYHGQWVTQPIKLVGIRPEEKAKVSPLAANLRSYHDVYERDPETGDQILIRKAFRKPNEEPGWDLTDYAMKYRIKNLSHIHYQEPLENNNPEGTEPNWVPPDTNDSNTNNSNTGNGQFSVKDKIARNKYLDPSQEKDIFEQEPQPEWREKSQPLNPKEKVGTEEESPFGKTDEPSTNQRPVFAPGVFTQSKAPVNQTAPLEGRLYIGMGLISFPFKDPKTGRVKTIMMVNPGDDVKISTVSSGRPPKAMHFDATVVDVFKSGMSEYDSNLVFCNLEYLQEMRGMIDPVTGTRFATSIQIKLRDYSKAPELIKRLKVAFPAGLYKVQTWEQKQGPLLAAVEVEKAILNVLLFLIIAVAGFGILAIFFMIVVEKTRDIGILKSLGASSNGIMSIFISYGLALGIVGSTVGVVIGLLFVEHINTIEGWITWITGRKVFDEKIYYFPAIPTLVNPMMVMWVAVGAIVIAVLASVLPARRAAKFQPVEALRYE